MLALIVYIVLANGLGFFLFGFDKTRAVYGGRRVPEKRLLAVAAVGGAAGSLLAMRMFRHKTKKRSFAIGIPTLLVAQLLGAAVLLDMLR